MIWDGECGFCRYWVTRWGGITGDLIDYLPYQEAAANYPDLDPGIFRQASRLITTSGEIYSGPDSAYKSLALAGRYTFLHKWYKKESWFMKLSDTAYQYMARRRGAMFRITRALWGSDPLSPRPFWVIYLCFALYFIYVLT